MSYVQLPGRVELQEDFQEVTTTATKAGSAWTTLFTSTLTPAMPNTILEILVTMSLSTTVNADRNVDFRILVGDTGSETQRRGTSVYVDNQLETNSGALFYRTPPASSGSQSVILQWRVRTGGGQARIRPSTNVEEHLSFMVKEYGGQA